MFSEYPGAVYVFEPASNFHLVWTGVNMSLANEEDRSRVFLERVSHWWICSLSAQSPNLLQRVAPAINVFNSGSHLIYLICSLSTWWWWWWWFLGFLLPDLVSSRERYLPSFQIVYSLPFASKSWITSSNHVIQHMYNFISRAGCITIHQLLRPMWYYFRFTPYGLNAGLLTCLVSGLVDIQHGENTTGD